jgi:hypothetical protein
MAFPRALPHGPITKVVDGVYRVRGCFQIGPLMRISRTMTIIQQADGLVIVNAIRLSAEGEAELARLGPVKHLVKLSDSHAIDEPYYLDRYRPKVWAMPGAKLSGITTTHRLGDATPVEGAIVLELPGAVGWLEVALWLPQGNGTLVTCDVVQNHVDAEGTSALGRIMSLVLGFKGGVKVPAMWRRYQKLSGPAVARALAPVTERSFENLITGHGPELVGGADARVRAAVSAASA